MNPKDPGVLRDGFIGVFTRIPDVWEKGSRLGDVSGASDHTCRDLRQCVV